MALSFYKIIDLTEYADNPDPKVVSQLSIVHEAFDGDLTQYYIDNTSIAEGDKASHALGIRVQDADNTAHYEYTDYDILKWGQPGARITRRRIDRLGVKAFPNIGAIAHYKLANQNLSKIVAPVNYKKEKTKAPTLAAVQNQDGSVTFSITSEIEYMCYRITMQLEFNRLEYVTYEDTYTVYSVPATGEYICWVTGYLAEGAIASIDSNDVILNLTGESPEWPAVLPGAKDKYLVGLDFNEQGFALGTMSDGQTIISTHPAPISGGGGGAAGSTVLIGTDAPAANFGNDGNLYIQYTMSLVGATREWINPNRTALGFTLDWIYNLSDKFEFTYKMNATPSQGGNWPWVLGVANVSTADIVIQFNLWGGRTVMNFGYNGSWAGDGEVSYNSPYDYTNYYTIKGEAGHFTLLRGATLDAINETVFTRNFTDADGDTTLPVKILGVFQSSNTLDMNLYKIDVWDKNDVLIHSYRANTDGLVDLVTNNVIDANVTGYTYGDIDNPGQYMPVFKAMFVKINNIWVPIDTGGSSGSGSI